MKTYGTVGSFLSQYAKYRDRCCANGGFGAGIVVGAELMAQLVPGQDGGPKTYRGPQTRETHLINCRARSGFSSPSHCWSPSGWRSEWASTHRRTPD
jgi:hypothetical protein